MTSEEADRVADRTTDLLHLDTQEFAFGVDLTVAEVHELTGPGSLDFGGSEFEAASATPVDPVKRDADDDYGWWELKSGTYRIVYNEGVDLEDEEFGLVLPHPRLMAAGGHHPSFSVFGEVDEISTLLSVGKNGCHIKENARVSRLVVLGD